jgi:two-component system chemotaxis sensor kinase CheA
MINQTPVLRLRDRLLPLVLLDDLLRLNRDAAAIVRDHFIVVIQVGATSFGVVVDRVFDTEEIVVKPVSQMIRGTAVYAGNTILGDGRVIMILDPNGLCAAAGQARFDSDTTKKTAQEEDTHNGELASLLLFRAGGSHLKAVPLEFVTRIEEIRGDAVEHVGGRPVVQYRGQLMPLIAINAAHEWKSGVPQPVLVLGDGGRAMGLVVDEVVDIMRDRLKIELVSAKDGLKGSAIIGGKATDLIDTAHYLSKGFADWLHPEELAPTSAQLGVAA